MTAAGVGDPREVLASFSRSSRPGPLDEASGACPDLLDPDDRHLVVAVHEAGHAVAALEYGIGLDYVTIEPGLGYQGRAVLHRSDDHPLVARATVVVAGFAATTLLFRGRDGRSLSASHPVFNGCAPDLRKLRMLRAIEAVDLSHVGPMLIRRADALVAITEALLYRVTLTGGEVAVVATGGRP